MKDGIKKRKSFFDELFGAKPFEELEELFERLDRSGELAPENFENRPFVYGFSLTRRLGGVSPEFREFGNLPISGSEKEEVCYPDLRKPLLEVLETEDKVHVIAEIPGIEKENIQLNATDLILELETVSGNPKYSERVQLPVKVDPLSAKATYKNGVLEVIFERLGSDSQNSIRLD
ncbi:MAG: Hsp20/alpha crystallin family protein [Methanosarcinaceae archaeon]|nr:Hsp20/alpha crystallin family protein [Methanosarcinaceae archaeon]